MHIHIDDLRIHLHIDHCNRVFILRLQCMIAVDDALGQPEIPDEPPVHGKVDEISVAPCHFRPDDIRRNMEVCSFCLHGSGKPCDIDAVYIRNYRLQVTLAACAELLLAVDQQCEADGRMVQSHALYDVDHFAGLRPQGTDILQPGGRIEEKLTDRYICADACFPGCICCNVTALILQFHRF